MHDINEMSVYAMQLYKLKEYGIELEINSLDESIETIIIGIPSTVENGVP